MSHFFRACLRNPSRFEAWIRLVHVRFGHRALVGTNKWAQRGARGHKAVLVGTNKSAPMRLGPSIVLILNANFTVRTFARGVHTSINHVFTLVVVACSEILSVHYDGRGSCKHMRSNAPPCIYTAGVRDRRHSVKPKSLWHPRHDRACKECAEKTHMQIQCQPGKHRSMRTQRVLTKSTNMFACT